jgi:hypothetical protein
MARSIPAGRRSAHGSAPVQPAIWLLFLMKSSETGGSILPVNLAEVPV